MCVTSGIRTMGCGKSRQHSPEDSETDLRNSGSYNYSKNSSSSKNSSGKNAKKKHSIGDEKREDEKGSDKEISEKSPSFRKISNGRARNKDRSEDIGAPLSSSPGSRHGASSSSSPSEDISDRSNGATKSQTKNYLLEVPNEISKMDTTSKTTYKDFKTITTSKAVHITTSQLEFFKMLDEKIEMGCDYQTSNEASEVSSLDETCKQ